MSRNGTINRLSKLEICVRRRMINVFFFMSQDKSSIAN